MGKKAEASKILIVEDERLVALAIETVLTRTGYRVPASVSSAEEAVRKTEEIGPDLVLMDIRLKGVADGV
jgi:CheY-like chemotaxis protein